MASSVQFFDGKTAAVHDVSIDITHQGIRIFGSDVESIIWPYDKLDAVETPHTERPLRLLNVKVHGARLIINSEQDKTRILELAPHLEGGPNLKRSSKFIAWTAAIIVAVIGLLYGVLNLAPQVFAQMMPDTWRETLGKQTENSLTKSARQCTNPKGQKALLKLAAKVAAGSDNPPDFSVRVYDMKMMNAFAVPGGRMVLTRGLLKAADTPDEIAGVFAHELGHVYHRHPEAALVRILGIQLLVGMFTGGGTGQTIGEVASLATVLSYSRDAERQADSFAQKTMKTAKINPEGLITFFGRVLKLEKKLNSKSGTISTMLNILSTHPGTEDRIKKLKALPKGQGVEVLTPLEWKALKNICNKTRKPTDT